MTKKHVYILATLLALVVIILLTVNSRPTYDWNITFRGNDKQPFGCAVFDDVMSASLKGGYEVKDDFDEKCDPKTTAILYVKSNIGGYVGYENAQELARARRLMKFVKNGGVVILATSNIHYAYSYDDDDNRHLEDSLYEAWGLEALKQEIVLPEQMYELSYKMDDYLKYVHERSRITWYADKSIYSVPEFMHYAHDLAASYDPKKHEQLLTTYLLSARETHVLAYSSSNKKGGVVGYVSVPLFFTNYSLMDDECQLVTQHLLKPVADRHLIRIVGVNEKEAKEDNAKENDGVFNYILKRPSLRWALYLTLITLALFSFFTMRRKMRAIPLLKETTNTTFEFAKYMGTFYFNRGKHDKPVSAEYQNLMKELTEQFGWNVKEMSNLELADAIASKTGEPSEKVVAMIRVVNSFEHNHTVEQKEMMDLIDYIKMLRSKL